MSLPNGLGHDGRRDEKNHYGSRRPRDLGHDDQQMVGALNVQLRIALRRSRDGDEDMVVAGPNTDRFTLTCPIDSGSCPGFDWSQWFYGCASGHDDLDVCSIQAPHIFCGVRSLSLPYQMRGQSLSRWWRSRPPIGNFQGTSRLWIEPVSKRCSSLALRRTGTAVCGAKCLGASGTLKSAERRRGRRKWSCSTKSLPLIDTSSYALVGAT